MAFYERGNNAVEIEEHGNVNNEASVVAVPTPSAEMPLRDLRRLLEHHKKRRTVRMFLRTLFDTSFDESGNEGLPEDQKSCCSILHFACLDSNGARGEEKIRIILQAAKDARADVPELIATRQEFYSFYGESWEPDHETELTIFTPLLLLMNNKDATIESIRIICQAWPRAVHFHGTCDDYTNIALKSLMYGESGGDVSRQVEVVKVLLDAAAKTKEGAMGLVAASDEVKGGVNPESFDYEDFVSEDTALHTVTRYHSRPECFVPLFLEVWPDALKYCSIDVWDHKGTCPLHNVAFHKSHLSYESRIKTIVAFLRGSTLEALAVALLFVGNAKDRVRSYVPNGLGFHLVKELGKETGPGRTLELQAELQATLQALVERKDVKGRTLLHYIAASCTKVNEHEMREKAEGISDANIRARGIHGSSQEYDLDPPDDVMEEIHKEEARLERRNRGHVSEVVEWILSMNPSVAFVQDEQGLNAFHYAMAMGKRWDGGLDDLARLVPEWPLSREGDSGLYPFMLAATPKYSSNEEVSTIYGLLRFEVSLVQEAMEQEWE